MPRGALATALTAGYVLAAADPALHSPPGCAAPAHRRRPGWPGPWARPWPPRPSPVSPSRPNAPAAIRRNSPRDPGSDRAALPLRGLRRCAGRGPWSAVRPGGSTDRLAALGVPAGTLPVGAGCSTGWGEPAGAMPVIAGIPVVAPLTWRHVHPGRAERLIHRLPGVSAAVPVATTPPSPQPGPRRGHRPAAPRPGLEAAAHGPGNAPGFALCSPAALPRPAERGPYGRTPPGAAP